MCNTQIERLSRLIREDKRRTGRGGGNIIDFSDPGFAEYVDALLKAEDERLARLAVTSECSHKWDTPQAVVYGDLPAWVFIEQVCVHLRNMASNYWNAMLTGNYNPATYAIATKLQRAAWRGDVATLIGGFFDYYGGGLPCFSLSKNRDIAKG